MAKRLTKEEWINLEKAFYDWCIAEGNISVYGFYCTLNDERVSQSGFEKRAREGNWKETAQGHLDRLDAPKLREELKEAKEEVKQKKQQPAIIMDDEGDPLAKKSINKVIETVQRGLGFNIESYTDVAQITRNQFKSILALQQLPMLDTEGKEVLDSKGNPILKPIDPMLAQSCNSLASALNTMHNVMRKSVTGSDEAMKDLFNLEEFVIQKTILYREQAKLEGKETGDTKKQEESHEFFKEQSRNEGIPIN